MAIDTASKRVSALRKTLPLPDGTIAQGDRQHIIWNYSGILAGLLALTYSLGRLYVVPEESRLDTVPVE